MLLVCECGHVRLSHTPAGMGTKELVMYCIECCPTDFEEQVHPFKVDNLASLEREADENE